jgi:putative copper resistance protein D
MAYLIPIGEGITYVLFSFLIGHVVLQFVKKDKKPDIRIPKPFLLLTVLLVVVFSFLPVLKIILFLSYGWSQSNDTIGIG